MDATDDDLKAVQGTQQQQALVVNAKTKTALANMLSIRLQGGHSAVNTQLENSASGQLRLMTAQHHAQQHQPPPPATPAAAAAPVAVAGNSQQTQSSASTSAPVNQRTTLSNVENHVATAGGSATAVVSGAKSPYTQTAARVAAVLAKSAAATPAPGPAQPRAHFYGHNPNLKLPPDMCLLGCIFLIVEYDRNGYEVDLWHRIIVENGGDVEGSYSLRVTHILCQTQKHPLVQQGLRDGKRCITAYWLSDVILKQQVLPPWLALHFPTPYSDEKPCRNLILCYSGFECEERTRVKKMIETVGAKMTGFYTSHNHILVCRRPDGEKYKKARELNKTVVNVQWLNEILFGHYSCLQQADSHKYQQFNLGNPFRIDYALVPHLMAAWKIPINVMQESYDRVKSSPPLTHRRKRPRLSNAALANPDPDQENMDFELDVVISNPHPPSHEKRPRVVFSGMDNTSDEQKKVLQLGGIMAKSCRDATHLIMIKPMRTFKMFCCLSTCKYILPVTWLNDCYKENTFLREVPYFFSETEFEKSHDLSIRTVLMTPNRTELFKGKIFHITPGVIPSPSSLHEIIECGGGMIDRVRKPLRRIQDYEPNTYFIVTISNDLHLVADVLRANIGVYDAEFVLSAVLKQKLDYDAAVKRTQLLKK